MNSGNKYHRVVHDINTGHVATVDVYAVIEAFRVTCPARQHAIKKLLCAGIRGKGNSIQDLTEAGESVARAVKLEEIRKSAAADQGDGCVVIESSCHKSSD